MRLLGDRHDADFKPGTALNETFTRRHSLTKPPRNHTKHQERYEDEQERKPLWQTVTVELRLLPPNCLSRVHGHMAFQFMQQMRKLVVEHREARQLLHSPNGEHYDLTLQLTKGVQQIITEHSESEEYDDQEYRDGQEVELVHSVAYLVRISRRRARNRNCETPIASAAFSS